MATPPQPAGRRADNVSKRRNAILDAAEGLFAREGIDSVSLRRIGEQAGSLNHFAVQYHFGSKQELIRAIFERRLPSLEQRRSIALADAQSEGRHGDPGALMDVLLRPLSLEVNAQGQPSYAAFLLSLHHHGAFDRRSEASALSPLTSQIAQLLHAANTGIDPLLSGLRLKSVFAMFLDALVQLDRHPATKALSAPSKAALLTDAVHMATAAYIMKPGTPGLTIG